jgi:glycosyltransferase involved in cell wall biosynthesis
VAKLTVEWNSYELPSYGFPEYGGKKKYGIVGGLGVVSDEVLSRISGKVNIIGIGMRRLRGRDLPIYEEIDGYRIIRPLFGLYPDETIKKCEELFKAAGIEFNGEHASELPFIPFLSDYGLAIPYVRTSVDPDLICAHDWMAILGSFEKAEKYRIPWIAFLHSLEAGRRGGVIHTPEGPKETRYGGYYAGSRTIRDIEAIGIKKSDVVFTVGVNMVKEVIKVGAMHGIPEEEIRKKTYPIHHGVDTDIYRPMKTDKQFDVIFIARFSPVKGVMELLDAVKMLKTKYPDIKVRMIGGGELEAEVYEKIKREGLEENVFVTTRWVPNEEKAIEINRAKIAVAPSKYEPHGQFDLEAGACGVPCINGTGGFMERMINDVTALQCNPFDPKDIAEKIDYLLSSPEKIEEMGSNAREFVVKYYRWDERAKIYPEIFEAVVEGDLKRLEELPLVVSLKKIDFNGSGIRRLKFPLRI